MVFDLSILIQSTILLFIITDPLGNVPIFMNVTKNIEQRRKRSTINSAVITAMVVLILFAIFWNRIFDYFSVSFRSFLIAGGILLFFVSFNMIRGQMTQISGNPKDFGVVPLGIPLIAGPGAITMSIILSQTHGFQMAFLSILISMILTWLTLEHCDRIMKFVGTKSSETLTRIMGIILAVISVQFVLNGLMTI